MVKELHANKTIVNRNEEGSSNEKQYASTNENVVAALLAIHLTLPRRLELPVFNGSDPMGWLARVEQYFEFQQIKESQKVSMALIGMKGSALRWIRWLRQKSLDMNWESLVSELNKRYDGRHAGNEFERLCSVSHTTSIDNYIDEFIVMVTHVPTLTNDHYLGSFMRGLQPRIRACFHTLHQPHLRRLWTWHAVLRKRSY